MRRLACRSAWIGGLAIAGTVLGSWLALPALAAGSGYGPPAPPVSNAPGGYSKVVTARTVGTGGGTVDASVNGATVKVVVPSGAFGGPAEIEITAPDLSAIPSGIAGVGVYVFVGGHKFTGSANKPLTVSIADPRIRASDTIDVWSGSAFVTATGSHVTSGLATATFQTDPDFAVLASLTTSVHTGKPFLAEGLVALGLMVLGSGLLLGAGRMRVRAR